MIHYQVTMKHTEETLPMLARKRYDLFEKKNQVARSLISVGALAVGILNFQQWWGALLLVYGSYMRSSKYAAANHTSKKIVNAIKSANLPFPESRYIFRGDGMEIITLPENKTLGGPLKYTAVERIAEDGDYFYIFRDEKGGFMIPKAELAKDMDAFRTFLEEKTGQRFEIKTIPLVRLIRRFAKG